MMMMVGGVGRGCKGVSEALRGGCQGVGAPEAEVVVALLLPGD